MRRPDRNANGSESGSDRDTGQCAAFAEMLTRVGDDPDGEGRQIEILHEHPENCPRCAALSGGIKVLRCQPDLSSDAAEAMRHRALATLSTIQRRRRRIRWAAVGMGASAAVLVALFVWPSHRDLTTEPTDAMLLSGRLEAADRTSAMVAGQPLTTDVSFRAVGSTAVIQLASEAILHLVKGTLFRFRRLEADHTDIQLETGGIAVVFERKKRGHLAVDTPLGRVSVTGTIFFVEVSGRDVNVDVLNGEVQVTPSTKPTWSTTAVRGGSVTVLGGTSLSLRTGQRRPFSSRRRAWLMRLFSSRPFPLPSDSRSWPGASPGGPNKTGGAATDTTLGRGSSPHTVPARATHRAKTAASDRQTFPAVTPPTALDLLNKAQTFQIKRRWRLAAQSYRALIRHHPAKGASVTTLVPLALIELNHLGQARAALNHFNRYLKARPRGTLCPEAMWGQARALRCLGRRSAEKAVLKRLLRRYPSSVNAEKIRLRLRKLRDAL